jgi:N-acetylglutamate synthase-like GNAT family acetyltransferase
MPITVREAKHGDEHSIIELIAELAQTTPSSALIEELVVRESARGRGVGSALWIVVW